MPGPYRAAVGKPHAVYKRPRRGQDPSLRTDPSTSARTYRAYVNYIRRAGCPHPAASSRGYPSTGSHPRRGRRPRRPGSLLLSPIPGKTPGPGMPGPYRAAAGKPPAVHKPRPLPTDRPINECLHPAASSRGHPSAGSHPRRGRRPRRPGNLPSPPIPGKTPGPGMPGPYRAAVGKPHAVRKRPRRGQDPSLRTDPSTGARAPGRHICRPYSAYMNNTRRAGCPHPAASSRGHPSTGGHPRRGRRPRRPGNLPLSPIPGKTPGPGMHGPYRAAVRQALCRP